MEMLALGRVTSALAGGLSTGFLASTGACAAWAAANCGWAIPAIPIATLQSAKTDERKRMEHLSGEKCSKAGSRLLSRSGQLHELKMQLRLPEKRRKGAAKGWGVLFCLHPQRNVKLTGHFWCVKPGLSATFVHVLRRMYAGPLGSRMTGNLPRCPDPRPAPVCVFSR